MDASVLKGLDGGLRVDGVVLRVGGSEGSLVETLDTACAVLGRGEGTGLRLSGGLVGLELNGMETKAHSQRLGQEGGGGGGGRRHDGGVPVVWRGCGMPHRGHGSAQSVCGL